MNLTDVDMQLMIPRIWPGPTHLPPHTASGILQGCLQERGVLPCVRHKHRKSFMGSKAAGKKCVSAALETRREDPA